MVSIATTTVIFGAAQQWGNFRVFWCFRSEDVTRELLTLNVLRRGYCKKSLRR